MSLEDKITAIGRNWGRNTAKDLKASLEQALKDAGSTNPEEAALTFYNEVVIENGSVKIQILATGDYWINVEDGRKPNSTPPPSNVVGKVWQNKHNIDARVVLAEIALKSAKPTLSRTTNKLSKTKKKLSYDEAAKRLSFIFARSIGKKGIEPKPFVDRVLNDGRLNDLASKLSEVIGTEIVASLDLTNEFRTIKITV